MGGRESKSRRYTIGSHGSPWTPVTARAEAERLMVLVAQGIDPVDAEKQRRREAVDLAFSNYADRFTASLTGGWARVVEQSLRLHIKPVLRDKTLTKVTRTDVVEVFDRMPAQQQANRRNVFAVLRRLFKWAISRGDIDRSPMDGMETPPAVKARDRWLSDEELRRITELLHEVARATSFPQAFLNVRTGERHDNENALLAAILADGSNLGLARMAAASQGVTPDQFIWTKSAYIAPDNYKAALARIIDAHHALPIAAVWGQGSTSSSDGQFFRSGKRGSGAGDFNAKYGVDPGFSFYMCSNSLARQS